MLKMMSGLSWILNYTLTFSYDRQHTSPISGFKSRLKHVFLLMLAQKPFNLFYPYTAMLILNYSVSFLCMFYYECVIPLCVSFFCLLQCVLMWM